MNRIANGVRNYVRAAAPSNGGNVNPFAQVANILRKYGTDAHVYLPGIGVINGLTAGNYLDSAGTTAATVDNPVGLVLDANNTIGTERLTNGDFSGGATGWTVTGNDATHVVTFSGGTMRFQSDTTSPLLIVTQNAVLTIGKTYRVTVVTSSYVSGAVKSDALGGAVLASALGTTTLNVVATAANFTLTRNVANVDLTIDSISIKEVTGIHAVQATTANKPILRRGAVNLLTYSEQFDNAAWTKANSTVTPNAVNAPNGTLTAENCLETATTGAHGVTQAYVTTVQTYTYSIYVKANGRDWVLIGNSNVAFGRAWFNIATGAKGTLGIGAISSDIVALSDGYYRVSVTLTATAASNIFYTYSTTADGVSSHAGDITKGIYIWGAQLETGSVASTYIPTTTAPASSPSGNYHWVHDSTDVLTATFPAGYESATIINTAETGQVTYTGQNIVGAYDIRGAEIGSELVTNGTFDTDTGWNKGAGVTITGGVAVFNAVASGAGLTQAAAGVTSGKIYKITATISGFSSGTLVTRLTSGSFIALGGANGTFSAYVVAGGNNIQLYAGAASSTFNIDNVTVRELTPKEYGKFIFRTGLTASELAIVQSFCNRLAGV